MDKAGDPVNAEGGGNLAEPATVGALLSAATALPVGRLDAEVLLAALLRLPRAQLIAFEERAVDPLTAAMFQAGLERLAAGEPLAYVTGVKEFWSLPVTVAPGVLVPRPETELLVELCLARLGPEARRVADLGTGSGAIALALSRERPAWRIVATDQSADALDIARANCRRLGAANVELRQGSWCEPLVTERFDAIVSNPPYIAPGDPALAALRHEPVEALVAADQGFADLFAIAACARTHLLPGGLLLLEHGAGQSPKLMEHLAGLGYRDPASHRDLAGHDRVVSAVWP
jgi:release factor glutamine methyltransferase|nr:MAG: peptide chain release factor N(5)-glutamine methyltransferase [Pseudomonadota bacterium]